MNPNEATVANQLRSALHEIEHGTEWQTGEPLDWNERIETALAVAEASDLLIRETVRSARKAGTTWLDIGDALNCTKQNAQQRYGV
jgi:hypothetical protein